MDEGFSKTVKILNHKEHREHKELDAFVIFVFSVVKSMYSKPRFFHDLRLLCQCEVSGWTSASTG